MTERTVLLAVDGSGCADEAYEWYKKNIFQENDKVVCAHCAQLPGAALAGSIISGEHQLQIKQMEKDIDELKKKYKAKCEEDHFHAKIKIVGGDAGKQIVDCAKEENASLIVVGTRGLGVIRRTILGSVSSYVLHHADVPVLIVPAKK